MIAVVSEVDYFSCVCRPEEESLLMVQEAGLDCWIGCRLVQYRWRLILGLGVV